MKTEQVTYEQLNFPDGIMPMTLHLDIFVYSDRREADSQVVKWYGPSLRDKCIVE